MLVLSNAIKRCELAISNRHYNKSIADITVDGNEIIVGWKSNSPYSYLIMMTPYQ